MMYRNYYVKKPRGGYRKITEPVEDLKIIQTALAEELSLYPLHNCVHGFVKERSPITNALQHKSKRYVLNIDIKNFFGSVTLQNFLKVLIKIRGVCGPIFSDWIPDLCFYEGKLPQGAPTSPVLANIFLTELDFLLDEFSKKNNLTYTRYADDLTFSGGDFLKEKHKEVLTFLDESLKPFSLRRNLKKTKLMPYYQRQVVTGIVVNNDILTLSRKKKRELFLFCMNTAYKDLTEQDLGYLEYVRSVNSDLYNKYMKILTKENKK